MVVSDQVGSMHISGVLPGVVRVGIAFPLQEVSQAFVSPESPVIDDGFHFIFRLISHEVRWWTHKVGAVGRSFDVWG